MSNGVLLFANNNPQVDYIKQSVYCAKRIKQYLNVDVALATPDANYLYDAFPYYNKYIDIVIETEHSNSNQTRRFRDGKYAEKKLEWNNLGRSDCFDISPFDKTIVMDTDYLICNNHLQSAFASTHNFMLYKDYYDLGNRKITGLDMVSDKSIPMYWATVFYFDKSDLSKMYFDLVKHIRDNWGFYRLMYQIPNNNFRNDFAFSIAIHIINGFQSGSWPVSLPGNMYLTVDYDVLHNSEKNKFKFLIDSNLNGQYTMASVEDCNIHIMNKFSLSRHIDKELANE